MTALPLKLLAPLPLFFLLLHIMQVKETALERAVTSSTFSSHCLYPEKGREKCFLLSGFVKSCPCGFKQRQGLGSARLRKLRTCPPTYMTALSNVVSSMQARHSISDLAAFPARLDLQKLTCAFPAKRKEKKMVKAIRESNKAVDHTSPS